MPRLIRKRQIILQVLRYTLHWASLAEGGRGNDDAALGILVARKAVRL